jgi:hypothetical protein
MRPQLLVLALPVTVADRDQFLGTVEVRSSRPAIGRAERALTRGIGCGKANGRRACDGFQAPPEAFDRLVNLR